MLEQRRARLRQERDIECHAIDGGSVQWLVDRHLGAEHLMAYRLTINPDSAAGHVHNGAEEALYVVEGDGEVRIEHTAHAVGKGQAVFVPEGHTHGYVNTSATPLLLVGAMAPLIDVDDIHPAMTSLDLRGTRPAALEEDRVMTPTRVDERLITPTLMGERSFRVLVSPEVGCLRMTLFTGVIPTGRAPLHAHPHEEIVYILAGDGRLWIEDDQVGELRPGSVVFVPVGVRHTLENTGADDMKVLGAFSPAGSPEAKLAASG
jgi:quercetin dioxygenase-like cupin family protein